MNTTSAAHDVVPVSLTRTGFASVTASFILIGATTSLFGPLLVVFSHRFQVSTPVAGQVLAVYFGGGVVGVIPGWIGVRHLSGRAVLSASLLTVSLGVLGTSLATRWALLLGAASVLGVGFGAVGTVLNTVLARTPVDERAGRLSIANAGFGAGAVITPLLLIATDPVNYELVMMGLGLVAFLLALSTRGVHAPPHRNETRSRARLDPRRRRRIVTLFVVAYVLYESVESGASGWMASQLHAAGFSVRVGILVTSGFWAGMAVTRSLGGVLHRRFRASTLVIASLVLASVCSLGIYLRSFAPFGYVALGFMIASIYPIGLMWLSTLSPHDSDATSAIILFAMAGSVLGPGAIDLLIMGFGVHVVPIAIAAFATTDAIVFASVTRIAPAKARHDISTST